MDPLAHAAKQFCPDRAISEISEYGSGNVNDTYRVTLAAAADQYFILQRINPRVFPQPALIMQNLQTCTEHMRERLKREPAQAARRWQVPHILTTSDNQNHYSDAAGSFWRALSFIAAARTYDQVRSSAHAREVGYALGKFQALISDLGTERLHDTLEGFHITPRYLQHYDSVVAQNGPAPRTPATEECFRFVEAHRHQASTLEDAKAQNLLRLRPIHGDPKVNNIMIDEATGCAVSMIDLDTVKPGLVHYDLGDCLRSCCNPLGEETTDFEAVRFEPTLCRAVLEGYLALGKHFLDENDYAFLFEAMRLLPFELGLRFFTDYLQGNVYFKVKRPDHNLARAIVQFRLTASIERQQSALRAILDDLR